MRFEIVFERGKEVGNNGSTVHFSVLDQLVNLNKNSLHLKFIEHMEIKNQNDGRKGLFFMEDGDQRIGLMHYTYSGPGKIIIDHTEVDEAYEGKGLGRQLVKAGVAFAREGHLKIIPECPFAKKVFDVTPDFSDVLF